MIRKILWNILLVFLLVGCQKNTTAFFVATYPESSSVELENWEYIATTRLIKRSGGFWKRDKQTTLLLSIQDNSGNKVLAYEQDFKNGLVSYLNSNWISSGEFVVNISHFVADEFETEIEYSFRIPKY